MHCLDYAERESTLPYPQPHTPVPLPLKLDPLERRCSRHVCCFVSFLSSARALHIRHRIRTRTFVSDIEVECLVRFRVARRSLPRRCARVEHIDETVAHLPHRDPLLVQRYGHQPSSIRRKADGRHWTLMALEHVESRGRLDVVYNRRAFVRSDSQSLRIAMKVDRRIAVGNVSSSHPILSTR
jgi:hypothetical protein